MDSVKYRRLVALLTFFSGIIALMSYFLVCAAVQFNFDFFTDPISIFSIDGVNGMLLKWSMITDVFGYYLLLLPVIFYLHDWLKQQSNWASVISISGLGYILLGSAGAAILAAIWPMHLEEFTRATPSAQETTKLLFTSFSAMVYGGLWNLLNAFLGGIWFLGTGVLLKKYNRLSGWLFIVIGTSSLLDWLGNVLSIAALADAALNIYLLLAPVSAMVLGAALYNKALSVTKSDL